MIRDPQPGKRVEILLGLAEWVPAVITRGPFLDEGIFYWEVETADDRGENYLTARPLAEMREP
jgi:hypothetical protein